MAPAAAHGLGRDEAWNFAILDAQGTFLGGVGIHRIDLKNSTAELGYWVRASASAAAWPRKPPGNFAAGASASAVGTGWKSSPRSKMLPAGAWRPGSAVREGVLRERILLHGRRHDCVLFSS